MYILYRVSRESTLTRQQEEVYIDMYILYRAGNTLITIEVEFVLFSFYSKYNEVFLFSTLCL
jgi:hypothetical protein